MTLKSFLEPSPMCVLNSIHIGKINKKNVYFHGKMKKNQNDMIFINKIIIKKKNHIDFDIYRERKKE